MLSLSGWATDKASIATCPYAWPWNVLGWPAISVPAGRTPRGLPVGAQLLGPAGSEPLLVSLAAQLEADQRWHERWPPVGWRTVAR
jgi:amidase